MTVCPNGHDSVSDDFCDVCGMRLAGAPATPATPSVGLPRSGPAVSSVEPCPRCGTIRTGQFCGGCGFNFGDPRYSPIAPRFTPVVPGLTPPPPSFTPAPPASQAPASQAPPPPRHAAPPAPQAAPPAPQAPPPAPQAAPPVPRAAPPPPQAAPPVLQVAPSAPQAAPPGPSSFPYSQITWTAVVGADRTYYEQVLAVSGSEAAAVAFPSHCAERRFALLGNQMRIGRRSVSRGLAPEIDLTGPPADPGISRLHAVLIAAADGSWAVLDPGSANGTLVNGTDIPVGDQIALRDGDRINLGAWTSIIVHRDGL